MSSPATATVSLKQVANHKKDFVFQIAVPRTDNIMRQTWQSKKKERE